MGDALTYSSVGVDIQTGDEVVEKISEIARSTYRPEVLGALGGFAGLFRMPQTPSMPEQVSAVASNAAGAGSSARAPRGVLVASTDGVGTKMLVAEAAGSFAGIGIDLVAMCVDDLACHGAEPLFFLDYLAMGKIDVSRVEEVLSGVADGCRMAGCALIGGETAEHPDAMESGHLDLAGFAVGMVDEADILGASKVRAGDALVGLASPGLRCNGYSLARKALAGPDGLELHEPAWPGCDHSLAEELLKPSLIYSPVLLAMAKSANVHSAAHITGGGIAGNLVRALPGDCSAVLERSSWSLPRIFSEIGHRGPVADDEMEKVFNLGLGMVVAVSASSVDDALDVAKSLGYEANIVGGVVSGVVSADRRVVISGAWPVTDEAGTDDRP